MSEPTEIHCDDLDIAIERHQDLGFRLDMIFPADSPREALMSKGGESVRILSEPPASAGGKASESDATSFSPDALIAHEFVPPAHAGGSDFVRGRAGMEYRDLIPGRLGGKVIASHIRLPFGGAVPDSVHYHKIDFQMIYCVRGRIKVIYEGQGEAFWLETGDCILQPPEIRHRVLYSEAGAEVVEVTSPAEHETWIDHETVLPSKDDKADRLFGTQRFLYEVGKLTKWTEIAYGGLSLSESETIASAGLVGLRRYRPSSDDFSRRSLGGMYGVNLFVFVLKGELILRQGECVLAKDESKDKAFTAGDGFVLPPRTLYNFSCSTDIELIVISLNV